MDLYHSLGVMPETQRSVFYSLFVCLASTAIITKTTYNFSRNFPPTNSFPISTALVHGLINS